MIFIALLNSCILLVALGYVVEMAVFENVDDKWCPLETGLFGPISVSLITCVAICDGKAACQGVSYLEDNHTCIGCDAGRTVVNGSQDDLTRSVFFERACFSPVVSNAVVSPGSNVVGTVRHYTCFPGYGVVSGASTATTCQPDGNWTTVGDGCILETCANGWHQIQDSCYFVKQPFDNMGVVAAKDYCTAMSSYLVQLESQGEINAVNDFIATTHDNGVNWWIGATDAGTEGTWRWFESNATINVFDWAPYGEEPNGGTAENFLCYWQATGGWIDYHEPGPCVPLCEKSTEVIV